MSDILITVYGMQQHCADTHSIEHICCLRTVCVYGKNNFTCFYFKEVVEFIRQFLKCAFDAEYSESMFVDRFIILFALKT